MTNSCAQPALDQAATGRGRLSPDPWPLGQAGSAGLRRWPDQPVRVRKLIHARNRRLDELFEARFPTWGASVRGTTPKVGRHPGLRVPRGRPLRKSTRGAGQVLSAPSRGWGTPGCCTIFFEGAETQVRRSTARRGFATSVGCSPRRMADSANIVLGAADRRSVRSAARATSGTEPQPGAPAAKRLEWPPQFPRAVAPIPPSWMPPGGTASRWCPAGPPKSACPEQPEPP